MPLPSSPIGGIPHHLTKPSLFALVSAEPRPRLHELEVANRSDDVKVLYSGPQLDVMEFEALKVAGDVGAKAGQCAGVIVIAADDYFEALGMSNEDDPDAQLLDSLRHLSEGTLQLEWPGRRVSMPLLIAYEFDVGHEESNSKDYCYYLSIDPFILQLARSHTHVDQNTAQFVLDVSAAEAAMASQRQALQDAATAAAAAAVTAAADRARSDRPRD